MLTSVATYFKRATVFVITLLLVPVATVFAADPSPEGDPSGLTYENVTAYTGSGTPYFVEYQYDNEWYITVCDDSMRIMFDDTTDPDSFWLRNNNGGDCYTNWWDGSTWAFYSSATYDPLEEISRVDTSGYLHEDFTLPKVFTSTDNHEGGIYTEAYNYTTSTLDLYRYIDSWPPPEPTPEPTADCGTAEECLDQLILIQHESINLNYLFFISVGGIIILYIIYRFFINLTR